MKWLTFGELRKLLADRADKPDDESVILQVQYLDVLMDNAFVRVDSLRPADERGYDLKLTLSIVTEDEMEVQEDG